MMARKHTLNTKRSNKPHRTQETRMSVLVPQLSLLWMLRQRRESRHCIPHLYSHPFPLTSPTPPSTLFWQLQLHDNSWQLCSFSTSQLHGLPATRMYGTTDVCVLYEVKKRRGTLLPKWQSCVVPHVSRHTTSTRRQAATTREANNVWAVLRAGCAVVQRDEGYEGAPGGCGRGRCAIRRACRRCGVDRKALCPPPQESGGLGAVGGRQEQAAHGHEQVGKEEDAEASGQGGQDVGLIRG